MMRDRVNITIVIKLEVVLPRSITMFTFNLSHSEGQGQDYAHFDCEHLVNADR